MYTPERYLSTGKNFKTLEGFAVPLQVSFNEVQEVGRWVFWRDAFPLDPVKILAAEIVNVPLSGQLTGTPARLLVKAAAADDALSFFLGAARLGFGDQKRAAIEHQAGCVQLVVEQMFFGVVNAPIFGSLRKGKSELLAELTVIRLGNA